MQNTTFYCEVGEKKMVRFSVTEGQVDGIEIDHPKYLIDHCDEENDSEHNGGYLEPEIDSFGDLEEGAVSLEMTHIENNSEHDVDEMLDLEGSLGSDEDMEAYIDEYFNSDANDSRSEQKITYSIPKEAGCELDENGYLALFGTSENNSEATTPYVQSYGTKHVNLNDGTEKNPHMLMKHSLHLNGFEKEIQKYISEIDDDFEGKIEAATNTSKNSQKNFISLEKIFTEDNGEHGVEGYKGSVTNIGSTQGSEVAFEGDIESSA